MALYAIGDVQGQFDALQALLAKLRFDPRYDELWFTGDLVNRGPRSLEVLRFVAGLGARAVTVLGNHDLHLLAVANGARPIARRDTLAPILGAADREPLLDWLRRRPLLHVDTVRGWALVHAGLVPQWGIGNARALAAEVEAVLSGPRHIELYARMYGDVPDRWDDTLEGYDRLRFIVNVCTRLRYSDPLGRINLVHKGAPGTQREPWVPWFKLPGRLSRSTRIVFGHWSTLGLYSGDNVLGLDSGCVWGATLTAARLDVDPPAFVTVPCEQGQPVGS